MASVEDTVECIEQHSKEIEAMSESGIQKTDDLKSLASDVADIADVVAATADLIEHSVSAIADIERIDIAAFVSDVEAVLYDAEAIGIETKVIIHDVVPVYERIRKLMGSCTIM